MTKLDYLGILATLIKETAKELILEDPLDKGYSKHLQNLA